MPLYLQSCSFDDAARPLSSFQSRCLYGSTLKRLDGDALWLITASAYMRFGESGQEPLLPRPIKSEPDITDLTIPLDAESINMSDDHSEGISARTRKRSAAKTPIRQTASKVKATLHLSVEASQRLSVHATMLGVDRSELVEQLIRENLKRFVVSDRGGLNAASEMSSPEAA